MANYTALTTAFRFRASELNVPLSELSAAIDEVRGSQLSGEGLELTGYSETEVATSGSSGTATLDYAAGNVHVVTVEAGVDTAVTFSNLPATGKAASATLLLKMAGAVPAALTVQGVSIDLTDVTASGGIIVEALRIDNTWFMGWHHAH